MAAHQVDAEDTIDYYDILIVGRTGIGKSCTADKLLIANPFGYTYFGEQPCDDDDKEAMVGGLWGPCQISMKDLNLWLVSDADRGLEQMMTTRLKYLVLHRSLDTPHYSVNAFYNDSATRDEQAAKFRLMSNETSKVRILDVPGFFETPDTIPNKATSKGLAIMREILRIQATMKLNFRRILYFIPVRGPLERHQEVLIELEQMVYYFGISIFDCMVLAVTVSPDVYRYIPPDIVPFSDKVQMKTWRSFELALGHIFPGEQLPNPPIIFISMNDTCEDINNKIRYANVIFEGLRLPFYYQTCTRCSIKTKVLPVFHHEEEEGLKVACFAEQDPSCCIPYDESHCHPAMVKKYSAITRIFKGLSYYVSNKKNLEKWADDVVCANCGRPSGTIGCMNIGTFYEFNYKQIRVDHWAVSSTDETESFGLTIPDDPSSDNYATPEYVHVEGSPPRAPHNNTIDCEHMQVEQPQSIDKPHLPPKVDNPAHNELHIHSLSEVEENVHVSFLKREILTCGYSGLHYKNHDISIVIPEGNVALDREEIHIEVGITMNGPFNFPRNSRLISPVVWFHLKKDKVLKLPFQVTLPHILNSLTDEKARYYQVCFCSSDHFSDYSGQLFCEFQPLISDGHNSVTCSFNDSYGTVKMSKFSTLCIMATVKPELQSDIGYRLTTVVCTSQLRHEAYFCLSYDLGVYLQV